MKDYIYVDTDLATSYFAQLNQGTIAKILSNNTTKDESTRHDGKEHTGEGGVSAFGVATGKYSKTELEKFSQAFMKSSSETVENVLHDHLIDILIEQVDPKEQNFNDGDFIKIKGQIGIYDFKNVKNSVSEQIFKDLYSFDSDYKEIKKELETLRRKKVKDKNELAMVKAMEAQIKSYMDMSEINDAGKALNILDILFPNTTLIKIGDTFSLCDNDKFRLSAASMAPITLSDRPVTIFATMISTVRKEDSVMPSEITDVLAKAGAIMPELLLTTLGIKKDGDYNLRPIAIYFE